jgi:hypothetical protein
MRQHGAAAATERRLRVHSVRARVDAARETEGNTETVTDEQLHEVMMRFADAWVRLKIAQEQAMADALSALAKRSR